MCVQNCVLVRGHNFDQAGRVVPLDLSIRNILLPASISIPSSEIDQPQRPTSDDLDLGNSVGISKNTSGTCQ